MKIFLTLFLIVLSTILKAQNNEFTITDDGLTKYVITEINGTNKEAAYKKVIDWVNREFDTPNKVIKGMIENEYIRIEGVSNTAMRRPAIGGIILWPIKFEIEISLKDNKYKFEIISLQEEDALFPKFSSSPFTNLDLSKPTKSSGYNFVRKSNGEFRNRYKYVSDISVYFNNLNGKLKEYILGSNNNSDNW
ncbi:hypothetical protein JET18_00885 [Chryseobacterium sp. L7]|uniref:DUF4468 domain-containing protein n=1 Tax=Chryseobacterium endalhagicum TaxID=2797638 RepID=A0ABS1QAN1_9FLAO|nr:hypothetical protein [Chryseobacterium endalhagicum]MBL1219377.1 hypothetical protein [Chryseobacterium endalhagicum]